MPPADGKRAVAAARAKGGSLVAMIAELDKTQNQVLERWASGDAFSRIDIVVADFVKRGQYREALAYMERVASLVQTICAKLRAKAGLESTKVDALRASAPLPTVAAGPAPGAAEAPAEDGGASGTTAVAAAGSPAPAPAAGADAKSAAAAAKQPQPQKRSNADRTKQGAAPADTFTQSERADLAAQLREAHAALEMERRERRTREATLRTLQERAQERGIESMTASARATAAERRAEELAEKVEALTTLLRAADTRHKAEAQRAAQYREKLTQQHQRAAEGGGSCADADHVDSPSSPQQLLPSLGGTPVRGAALGSSMSRVVLPHGGGGGERHLTARAELLALLKEREGEIFSLQAAIAKHKFVAAVAQKRAAAAEAALSARTPVTNADREMAAQRAAPAGAAPTDAAAKSSARKGGDGAAMTPEVIYRQHGPRGNSSQGKRPQQARLRSARPGAGKGVPQQATEGGGDAAAASAAGAEEEAELAVQEEAAAAQEVGADTGAPGEGAAEEAAEPQVTAEGEGADR